MPEWERKDAETALLYELRLIFASGKKGTYCGQNS